jgi:hypothetical protein
MFKCVSSGKKGLPASLWLLLLLCACQRHEKHNTEIALTDKAPGRALLHNYKAQEDEICKVEIWSDCSLVQAGLSDVGIFARLTFKNAPDSKNAKFLISVRDKSSEKVVREEKFEVTLIPMQAGTRIVETKHDGTSFRESVEIVVGPNTFEAIKRHRYRLDPGEFRFAITVELDNGKSYLFTPIDFVSRYVK